MTLASKCLLIPLSAMTPALLVILILLNLHPLGLHLNQGIITILRLALHLHKTEEEK